MRYGIRPLLLSAIGALLQFSGIAEAEMENFWPFWVREQQPVADRAEFVASMGPLFAHSLRDSKAIVSLRPLWTQIDSGAVTWSGHLLYPLVNVYRTRGGTHGSLLNLIRFQQQSGGSLRSLDVFPFLFYRASGSPETSYSAVWPLGGKLKNRLWRDEIAFAAWPLWVRTRTGDETRWHFPYPLLRFQHGPHSSGFGIWPLYGQFQRANEYRRRWALWPLFYHYTDGMDMAEPMVRFGAWPFYHSERAEGLISRSWVWPFFGYTREFEPRIAYAENRYFYPFLVQGRGAQRRVNRWLPLYAFESRADYQKRWYLWPLLKTEQFGTGEFARQRRTMAMFLYRDEFQPLRQGTARFNTLWPLYGYRADGQGRQQLQAFDPFSVFFPRNEKVRENWAPIFALYRYDARAGQQRHSLLWNLLVFERYSADAAGAVGAGSGGSIGPVFEWQRQGNTTQWKLLKGMVGYRRDGDGQRQLRFFWLPLNAHADSAESENGSGDVRKN